MTHQEAIDTLAAERYLLDEMPADERSAFEEHFFDCEVCADDMRSAAALLQGTKAGFAGVNAAGAQAAATRRRIAWWRAGGSASRTSRGGSSSHRRSARGPTKWGRRRSRMPP